MKLTRQQLFSMVWGEPVKSVAARLRLSDVGLAKLCRRNNIPLPARGYWAKRLAGRPVTQTALPNPNVEGNIFISETRTPPTERQKIRDERTKLIESARASIGPIPVAARLRCRHPLTRASKDFYDRLPARLRRYERQKHLRYRPVDFDVPPMEDYGRYSCPVSVGFDMCVALPSADRALRILDALVIALEERGLQVGAQEHEGYRKVIEASKDGEGILFEMSESYSRRPRPATEVKQDLYGGKYTYHANGRLRLTLSGRSSGGSQWSDGRFPLEEQLPAIVAEFEAMVPRQREERERREAERRAAQERERLEWIARQKRAEELRTFETALEESELLVKLERLDMYLTQVEEEYKRQHGALSAVAADWLELIRRIRSEKHPLQCRIVALSERDC